MGKRVAFVVFTLVGTLVLLGLGTWQWQRRAEKRDFTAMLVRVCICGSRGSPRQPRVRPNRWVNRGSGTG